MKSRSLTFLATTLALAGCSTAPTAPSQQATTTTFATGNDSPSVTTTNSPSSSSQLAPQKDETMMLGTPSTDDIPLTTHGPAELIPVAVRTGSHADFDRFVVEFTGTGQPGWYAKYTTQPAAQGSGFPVPYSGNIALVLGIEGTPYPMNAAGQDAYITPQTYPGTSLMQSVEYTGSFEAQSQFVLGLDRKRPYSVSFLENPPRVVVDISH